MTEFKVIFIPHAALQFISICSASNEGVKLIKSPGQKDVQSPNAWKEAQGKDTYCHTICDKVSTLRSWQEGSKKALEILTIFVSAAQLAPEIWDVLLVIHLCINYLLIVDIQYTSTATTLKIDKDEAPVRNFHGPHSATPCSRA